MSTTEEERKSMWRRVLGTFVIIIKAVMNIFGALYIVSKAAVLQYIQFIQKIVGGRQFFLTKIISWTLMVFVPVAALLVPVGFVVIIATSFIVVDQSLEYDESVAIEFVDPANQEFEIGAKGALLFAASYYQMEKMLNRFPYWSANDPILYPQGWWDNSPNTQRGVWWASSQMIEILSDRITRYGTGQPQNPLTLAAFKKFHLGPDEWNWWVTDSEGFFEDAISDLKKFEAQAIINPNIVNIRTDDLEAILIGIKDRVLGEPYGRLTARSREIKQSELDDIVHFARGAAMVARDELSVLRFAFTEELSRGGLDNLDAAIDSLDAIIDFHPWWIWRGDGDSMFADHRAKLSRYYSEVFRRIEDLAASLRT